ncbi:MAG: pantetheine-phosphate adenylyltransferase [Campylobacteraceae bacterium]|jgi:pantetheine-phosphate adenylyltransferase|nr:pantetheine-phosphate adenylyltransferase [Campylobacteraceae bacterium]
MIKTAIYPGTFDPITNGHIDIIKRARRLFECVLVAVANSDDKRPMFSLEKRVEMARAAVKNISGVEVEPFSNLLVDFAWSKNIYTIIRGLRAVSDFEYELQMGYANASLNKEIETLYLMPSLENAFISSSVIRTILKHNGNASHLYPKEISAFIKGRA